MDWKAVVALAFGGSGICVTLLLTIYLELRIHALIQSGDLPKDAVKPFPGGLARITRGVDLEILFSERFRTLDGQTRTLVPIIRVALIVGTVGFFASVFLQ